VVVPEEDGWDEAATATEAGRSAGRCVGEVSVRRSVGDEAERPADLARLCATVAVKAFAFGSASLQMLRHSLAARIIRS
jgi:hypothetical protein